MTRAARLLGAAFGPLRAAALALLMATGAAAECRLALILALDVSGSVDEVEYRLQLDGVAGALTAPAVVQALFEFPDAPVALLVFEWSARSYQRLIVPWTVIGDPATLDGVAAHLRGWQRRAAPQTTGIGAALGYSQAAFGQAPYCWRQTLDISGDGKNNDWPDPRRFYDTGGLPGVTVNALVIAPTGALGNDRGKYTADDLIAYFEEIVIRGPDAFIERAEGFDDYQAAMTRKLLRELEGTVIGRLDAAPGEVLR